LISAARHVQDYLGDSQVPEVNISYITDEKLFFGSKMEQKLFIAVILCHVLSLKVLAGNLTLSYH
jgi:hypothetical protein